MDFPGLGYDRGQISFKLVRVAAERALEVLVLD